MERPPRVGAEARVAHIQAVFEGEPTDSSWADATEASIRLAGDRLGLGGSRIDSVQCRATLCRAEVLHDSEDEFEAFAHTFPMAVPQLPRATMKRLQTDGGLERTIVYLAREGHPMPSPARP